MRVTKNLILSFAFEKMKHLFRLRQLMILATNHDGKKVVKRTFFAWKRFVNKKEAFLKTLMREQNFIRIMNIIIARLERLQLKRMFQKWKGTNNYNSRKIYTKTSTILYNDNNNTITYDDNNNTSSTSVIDSSMVEEMVDDVIIMTPNGHNVSTNTATYTTNTSTATKTKRRYYNTNINTSISTNKFDVKYRDKADINTNIMMSQVINYFY
jgi:hypothetical protein